MRFRSLVISIFGVLCGFMLIAGVVESGAAERKADQLDPVVFAIPSLSAEYLPLVIAEEKGFYRPAGIRPQIQAIKSAVALTGTSTGDVAYVFASTSTIGAVMQGLPLRVVAYVNVGSFFLFSRPEIRTIADLKGKVIAQATVAGLQDYLLKAMLKANGLDPTRDVQYVSLGDDSLGLAAVKSGQVHAAIAQVPTPLIAEKEGLRIIGNTADFARFPTAAIGTSLEAFVRQCRTGEEFGDMIRRQFDVLYREGAASGRVMAIALHPYLVGIPHRIDALSAALDYICAHEGVWLATGEEIAKHYLASAPPA